MQTIKNKTFPIINSIRLLIQVGVILAIITTSFLVQKQPVHAATNSNINTSILSRPGSFKKTSPTKAATKQPTNPTLSWGTSNGATSYQYCINTTKSCKAPAAWISTGTNTQETLSGLTQGKKYYWQVQSSNTSGKIYANGSKSAWWSLTIATTLTPTSTSVAPTLTPTATSVAPTPIPTATSVPPTPTTTVTQVPTQVQSGNIYYVATNGNDANPGTFEQPFKTIQKGVDRLIAGDTLYIRAGTYTEKINIIPSGSPLAPIVISSYPGETAVMDGNGLDPTLPIYTSLITLSGSYIIVENLELTYPKGRGIWIAKGTSYDASHNIIRNLNIHHTWVAGISVYGSDNLIENNKVWKTVLMNDCDNRNPDPSINCSGKWWAGALSFGASSYPYYGLNTTVRNNEVYQNYGEGILCMYTDNGLIEDNRVWDNWAAGIYPDQCSFTTIKNNLVYYTSNHEYWRDSNSPPSGILISNEGNIASHPIGHDHKIFNNIIIDAGSGIHFWTGLVSGSALINDVIANNTIVKNNVVGTGIKIDLPNNTNHQNTIIINNLVLVDDVGRLGISRSAIGLTFTHNLWSRTPDASVVGAGDIVGNPLLSDPIHIIDLDQITHPVEAHWYQLTSSSPAIARANPFSWVITDFFGNQRDSSPDIGAHEFPK